MFIRIDIKFMTQRRQVETECNRGMLPDFNEHDYMINDDLTSL